jgi:hypothetical protein
MMITKYFIKNNLLDLGPGFFPTTLVFTVFVGVTDLVSFFLVTGDNFFSDINDSYLSNT